ncbi:PASTA domain-containing protein [Paraconexibacter sp. AEG42_29]|uniref:PASTA domain-containing protein n=1 Tax=Paraconexibacter sp. AEG42_29 TaxID=2997339 RepID=UPI00339D7175
MRAAIPATCLVFLLVGCGGEDTARDAPDVRGTDLIAALETLRAAGYKVDLCGPEYSSGFLRDTVTDQRMTAPRTVQLETDDELSKCDSGD